MTDSQGTSPRPDLLATRRSSRTSVARLIVEESGSRREHLATAGSRRHQCEYPGSDASRFVVREHRGVLDPQLPGTLEPVHNLRGDHAAVVLETQGQGPTV